MGKKIAAPRSFPLQLRVQSIGIDGDQDQIGRPGKMLSGGPGKLGGRGEMDEAIAQIHWRSEKPPFGFGLTP
jgi:hypothetical protein